jgi:hypothetical protein
MAVFRQGIHHLHQDIYAWLNKPTPKASDEGREARLF